ncbi:MAG: tetratricopeptide repeat protein [Candidatus Marinimicrobia bacterium]|nr:tetratricopeptide repeat protein [Candidatus Neomarinimicrobiota bacterium]
MTISKVLEKSKKLIQNRKYTEAEQIIHSFCDQLPGDWRLLHLLAISARKQNKFMEAHKYLDKALKINNDAPQLYNEIGLILDQNNQYNAAIENFKKAIKLKNDYFNAYYNLANTLHKIGKPGLALNSYKIASELNPNVPDVYLNIAIILENRNNFKKAINILKYLIESFPDYMEAYNRLGLTYKKAGFLDKSEAIFRKGITKNKDFVRFYGNLANVLQSKGDFKSALNYYNKAIELEPNYYEAIFSRSLLYLLLGKFKKGWKEYEYRWKLQGQHKRNFEVPQWRGETIKDKKLLLWAEQGLGDSIQFIRYAPLVKKRVGKLIIECQSSLIKLFKSISGIDTIIDKDDPNSDFDYHLPMLSLPRVFKTNEETIPNTVPYLKPDKKTQQKINNSIDTKDKSYNIAFAWAGNKKYQDDHRRSCQLEHFENLTTISGTQLFSIQKGEPNTELQNKSSTSIINLSPIINDFADTAAIIKKMDLVISVDTSVAHLAGALGQAVWLLLPFYPDWRWMLDRQDTPWYPTMRLFRQEKPGDWKQVFQQIRAKLEKRKISDKKSSSKIEELIHNGKLKQAEENLQKLLKQAKDDDYHNYLLACIRNRQKFYPQAIKFLKQAIEINPHQADYYTDLGRNYYELGKFSKAEEALLQAISNNTKLLSPYIVLGKIELQRNNIHKAIFYLKKAHRLESDSWETNYYLGKCYYNKKDYPKSISFLQNALKLNSNNSNIYNMLGLAYKQLDNLSIAQKYLHQAIKINPNSSEIYNNLANIYKNLGKYARAKNLYKQAIKNNKNYYRGYFNLGQMYHKQDNLQEALIFYEKVLLKKPDFPPALNNAGAIYLEQAKFSSAKKLVKKALQLEPENTYALITLGNIYNRTHQYQNALDCYNRVLDLDPLSAEAHANLGSTYYNLRKFKKSIEHLNQALEFNPDHIEAHWNRALTLLTMGNFNAGWQEYEWRWKKKDFQVIQKNYPQKRWHGAVRKDKTLLIWHEQGFGDTIQFARFIRLAQEKFKKIILQVPRTLKNLMQTIKGVDKVITGSSDLPEFDLHCPLMSLPNILNITVNDITPDSSYINIAHGPKEDSSLISDDGNMRVGFVWAGSPLHKNDDQRSCPLSNFKVLFDVNKVTFYSLQKAPQNKELETIHNRINTIDLSSYLTDFMKSASIITKLDLVIAVDTAVAHLAGAIGKETWILLPRNADWRWMQDQKSTTWYPTATLFRQSSSGDWDSVFKQLHGKLLNKINK